jgi:hypothetical protein
VFDDRFNAPFNQNTPFDQPGPGHQEEARADRALHAGLRDLPTPEPSADFDTRILAALAPRPPWWQAACLTLRPALPAAVCALTVMLALLHLSQQMPIGTPSGRTAGTGSSQQSRDLAQKLPGARSQGGATQQSSLESLESIDNIDLNSASLSFFIHPIRHTPGKRG